MFDVSIVILNWNTRQLLADCIETIFQYQGNLNIEIIVVDNNSSDDSQTMIQTQYPHVKLIENHKNVGFAKGNNQGVVISQAKYVLLLNSDAFLHENSLQILLGLIETTPQIGIVGAHLRNEDGTFQASHTDFPTLWQELLILSGLGRLFYGHWYPSYGPDELEGAKVADYVVGACLLVRKTAYESIGGFDETYFMYAEEVDLCYRMRQAGCEVWYQPVAKVTHLGGASSRHRPTQRERDLYRSRIQFFRTHYGNIHAELLKWQIYAFTTIKFIGHGLIRFLSGGRYGRLVVSPFELYTKKG
ncbi:MAG: hypothetical protein B6242_01760 [Anaerolineaceae bacterium 4572_78]|nr:MAG: hypothetical protein B6242_01760 [Anaerolineaceae bacterium 4572_78]